MNLLEKITRFFHKETLTEKMIRELREIVTGQTPDEFLEKTDYRIHGGWGDHIEWSFTEEFKEIAANNEYSVWGHLDKKPEIGDTLLGEFKKSFIKFCFIEIDYPGDPPDMFFGKVMIVGQKSKETQNERL